MSGPDHDGNDGDDDDGDDDGNNDYKIPMMYHEDIVDVVD